MNSSERTQIKSLIRELRGKMQVELVVDEESITLNAFTEEIIGNVASAMAETLRGVGQDWKEITIKVKA
jgi:hypothetical protein